MTPTGKILTDQIEITQKALSRTAKALQNPNGTRRPLGFVYHTGWLRKMQTIRTTELKNNFKRRMVC